MPKQVLYKVTRSSRVRDQERMEACHNLGMDMSLSVMTVMTVKKNPVMKDRSKNLFLCLTVQSNAAKGLRIKQPIQ